MVGSVVRTAVLSSAVTAVAVAGVLYAAPRLMGERQPAPIVDAAYYPLATNGVYAQRPVARPPVQYAYQRTAQPAPVAAQRAPVVYEPQVETRRSTEKSVLIVAGSAATGAAIGGLAGGKKGAAIGAIAGGAGGFIYDRHTANKRR